MANNYEQRHPPFIYMNESSIHPLLFCQVCRRPLIDPVKTTDNRRMCRQCWIDSSLSTMSTKSPDPCEPIDEVIILKILDGLLVECSRCSQKNIRRGDYSKHEQSMCMNACVSCTAVDLKCSWSGPRHSLRHHVAECPMEPLRPVLAIAIEQLEELQRRVLQLEEYLDQSVERTPFERQLIDLIQKCSDNSLINLQAQRINDEHVDLVIELALRRKHCTILDINSNQIGGEGAELLADSLQTNQHLEKLYLGNNCTSDRGAIAFAQVLANENQSLRVLGLESNGIGDEGIKALSNMLRTNRYLTSLSLSANQITDDGLKCFIDVFIREQSTIEELNLNANQGITDRSFKILKRLIESNHNLKKLTLINCQLSEQSREDLRRLVDGKMSLRLIL